MSFSFAPAKAIDLLAQVSDMVRPDLDRQFPIKSRIRCFWAAAKAARDLGASDVVEEEFTRLALDTGLSRDLRRDDLQHVFDWAMRGLDPFDGYGK